MKKYLSLCFLLVCLICSCTNSNNSGKTDEKGMSVDSLALINQNNEESRKFASEHHFSKGYNFLVKVDTLYLKTGEPDEILAGFDVDSVAVLNHQRVVVSDFFILPEDVRDSVWIELVCEDNVHGWIHEKYMLDCVVPDDPISQFIDIFSNVHLIAFAVFIIVILSIYIIVHMRKSKVPMVHFNDIDSFYPTLFCIVVAASATFYGSIQLFALETWREFYFHPTLNPFNLTPLLSVFITSAWAIVILGLAAVDDARRHLPIAEAVMYIFGMGAICALNYIVFSISTLYYVGYPLLVAYIVFAIYRFLKHGFTPYLCGNCGRQLHRKGRCPYCGMLNN